MKDKYLNEAMIGNKEILATYTEKGELQRLYCPTRDNRQYIDFFQTGVKINNSDLIYLHKDVNNTYKQYYDTDTNILNTEIVNLYFNLKILQTDFVMLNENVIVKKYTFVNEGKIDLDIKFLLHSSLLSDSNNTVGCKMMDKGMIQYSHDYVLATFVKQQKIVAHQINGSSDNIKRAEIYDKDYIGMSSDSSMKYDMGAIAPNEKKELEVCILIDQNQNISDLEKEVDRITKKDIHKEYQDVKTYWRKYVKKHRTLKLEEPENGYQEIINEIYTRTILLFPLLTNSKTGGVIAAPEVDESFSKCGRYGYCWPRDAVFITKALDILDMSDETEKFYTKFCKITQSKNGMWEQRFFTDGKLAPCWGYQIDETASVIFGVFEHFKYSKSEKFLKETLQMCERGVDFLKRYIKDVLENTNKYHTSYDLWEMNEGIHFYSLSSIYSAFETMKTIYKVLENNISDFENNRLKDAKVSKNVKELEELQREIKKYIQDNLVDENQKTYVRNKEDKQMDISMIGAVIPFEVFKPKDKIMLNTIEKIELSLRTYTGGYRRFENDNYMQGNPWPIANLWLTLYYIEAKNMKKAKETFDFVVKTAGKHFFLGEQIDNETLKPNWVLRSRVVSCNVHNCT